MPPTGSGATAPLVQQVLDRGLRHAERAIRQAHPRHTTLPHEANHVSRRYAQLCGCSARAQDYVTHEPSFAETKPTVQQPNDGRQFVAQTGCRPGLLESPESVFESFEHAEALVEIEHQSERHGVVVIHMCACARPRRWRQGIAQAGGKALRKRRSASGMHTPMISTHHPIIATTGCSNGHEPFACTHCVT